MVRLVSMILREREKTASCVCWLKIFTISYRGEGSSIQGGNSEPSTGDILPLTDLNWKTVASPRSYGFNPRSFLTMESSNVLTTVEDYKASRTLPSPPRNPATHAKSARANRDRPGKLRP